MNSTSTTTANSTNGQSTAHDLFALTDEQILEIEPEAQDIDVGDGARAANGPAGTKADSSALAPAQVGASARNDNIVQADRGVANADRPGESTSHQSPATSHAAAEPPKWLAERMADPQNGGEARELWNDVQQTRQDAAAYREVFAKPKEARVAADRARLLDDIDRAYFTGDAQQRSQLAATMLREDPAAFREMVFAGLRALEDAGKQGSREPNATADGPSNEVGQRDSSAAGRNVNGSEFTPSAAEGLGMTENNSGHAAQLAAYAAFERAANQELEQSVGGAIERTLDQALPNANRTDGAAMKGRLAATIRQDIEKALQDDRQLGQQVAQILAARRLNDESRAQVVRLIGDRARQLVPGTAKRVLQDWTQTTLAAHRSKSQSAETGAGRPDLVPANGKGRAPRNQASDTSPPAARNDSRGSQDKKIDYRKLSDDQILSL
jgi:hypothetical protein